MTTGTARFRCPACDFAVFNRRVPRCERCGIALPEDLLFDAGDLRRMDEESRRVQKIRDDLAREAEAEARRQQQRRGGGG